MDAIKALKAIKYSNAVAEGLDSIPGFAFSETAPSPTNNNDMEARAKDAVNALVEEDLPAYITHIYTQTVRFVVCVYATSSWRTILLIYSKLSDFRHFYAVN
jgi:hypothetical protein